jgi:hypothetical protein
MANLIDNAEFTANEAAARRARAAVLSEAKDLAHG